MIRVGIFLLARDKNAVEGYFAPSTAFFILGIVCELYRFTMLRVLMFPNSVLGMLCFMYIN